MCDVVKKFTFAISSPDEFLYLLQASFCLPQATAGKVISTACKFVNVVLTVNVNVVSDTSHCGRITVIRT